MITTLDLLRRCSWRADRLFKARGSLTTVLWVVERNDGREWIETECDAPLEEATDDEVLVTLAAEDARRLCH